MKGESYTLLKNILDLLVGSVLFLLMLPVGLMIALIIKLDSKGPVFFKQKRIGKNNKPFHIYKFRSMKKESPKDVPTHLLSNPDTHMTKVGKFLRKTSLDELPQIINVMRREMSLIGPRPALWNQEDLIQLRTKKQIDALTPGITGWAQVNGRDELSIADKVVYDKYYKDNFSLWLDVKILYLTIFNVISKKGIVEGAPKD